MADATTSRGMPIVVRVDGFAGHTHAGSLSCGPDVGARPIYSAGTAAPKVQR